MIARSLRGEPATDKGEREGEVKKEGEGEQMKEGEQKEGEMKSEEEKKGVINISDYEIDSDGSQDVEVNRIFER